MRNAETSEILGACPMYLKGHSYGEYVFDHSWASTFARMGQRYYPKLQSCVPFTPAPGNRLLLRRGPYREAVRRALAEQLMRITGAQPCCSICLSILHCLRGRR